MMETLLQDLRYALRQLGKQPGLTAIIVLTLGLGVGANTAIFSVLNGWLFRPLPVPAAEQIMVLAPERKDGLRGKFSYPDLLDFRKQADTFSGLYAYEFGAAGLSVNGKAQEFVYSGVTGNYFSTLGIRPVVGRMFLPGEGEKPGEPLFVVLGFSYWQRKLGGDFGIVGKQVLFNGRSATVIGVAAETFHGSLFAFDMDGYVPLSALADTSKLWTDRDDRELFVQGRLKSGVTLAQAKGSIDLIAEHLAGQYPATNKGVTVRIIPERLSRPVPLVASFAPMIAGMFLTLAALVLLLACMNVASILLARASGRDHEIAVRLAVGAGHGRLIRQVLTENLLVAVLGGIAGALIGSWALKVSATFLHPVVTTQNFGYRLDSSFDLKVFADTLASAILTGIVIAMWPALRARRINVNATLHKGSRTPSTGMSRQRLRGALVVAQLAGSLMLLIVAGLFVRSLKHTEHMYLGFDPDHVLIALMDPQQIGYDETRTSSFYQELEQQVRSLPGVQSASLSVSVPMEIPSGNHSIFLPGRILTSDERAPLVSSNSVSPSYFATMRVPLLRGRGFLESDKEGASLVAVVNQTMARKLWPNEDPIGKRFSVKDASSPLIEVIGMVSDGQYLFISPDPQPHFYRPIAQNYSSFRSLQIRTSVPTESLIPALQEQIRNIAPDLPLIDVRSMEQVVHGLGGLFIFRLAAALATLMGILGLTLAIVGIYGVISFAAAQRTPEFGVRMALGAHPGSILKLVLGQGFWLVTAGMLIGLLGGWGLSRVMVKLLVGITAADPLTFAGVTLLLAVTALLACYLPARRATRVDPMAALRYE